MIRGLNPKSRVLRTHYDELVAEYEAMTLDGLEGGLGGLYRNFELLSDDAVLDTFET